MARPCIFWAVDFNLNPFLNPTSVYNVLSYQKIYSNSFTFYTIGTSNFWVSSTPQIEQNIIQGSVIEQYYYPTYNAQTSYFYFPAFQISNPQLSFQKNQPLREIERINVIQSFFPLAFIPAGILVLGSDRTDFSGVFYFPQTYIFSYYFDSTAGVVLNNIVFQYVIQSNVNVLSGLITFYQPSLIGSISTYFTSRPIVQLNYVYSEPVRILSQNYSKNLEQYCQTEGIETEIHKDLNYGYENVLDFGKMFKNQAIEKIEADFIYSILGNKVYIKQVQTGTKLMKVYLKNKNVINLYLRMHPFKHIH